MTVDEARAELERLIADLQKVEQIQARANFLQGWIAAHEEMATTNSQGDLAHGR